MQPSDIKLQEKENLVNQIARKFSSFLNTSNYQLYNRDVARKLKSKDAAIFLSELINRFEYHKERNELTLINDNEYFYYTREMAEERLVFSRKEQDSAIETLLEFGLIDKKVKGIPPLRYFNLKFEAIYSLFLKEKVLNCPKETNQFPEITEINMSQTDKFESRESLTREKKDTRTPTKNIIYDDIDNDGLRPRSAGAVGGFTKPKSGDRFAPPEAEKPKSQVKRYSCLEGIELDDHALEFLMSQPEDVVQRASALYRKHRRTVKCPNKYLIHQCKKKTPPQGAAAPPQSKKAKMIAENRELLIPFIKAKRKRIGEWNVEVNEDSLSIEKNGMQLTARVEDRDFDLIYENIRKTLLSEIQKEKESQTPINSQ